MYLQCHYRPPNSRNRCRRCFQLERFAGTVGCCHLLRLLQRFGRFLPFRQQRPHAKFRRVRHYRTPLTGSVFPFPSARPSENVPTVFRRPCPFSLSRFLSNARPNLPPFSLPGFMETAPTGRLKKSFQTVFRRPPPEPENKNGFRIGESVESGRGVSAGS